MHKKPFSKQRYIAASGRCTTKPLSAMISKILKLVLKTLNYMCSNYFKNYGFNPMWIIKNFTGVFKKTSFYNRQRNSQNVKTSDFSTMYTSIPHKKLKTKISWVITKTFKFSKKKYITVYKNDAKCTTKKAH